MSKAIMLAASVLALAACHKSDQPKPPSEKAAAAAGDRTLDAGLGDNHKFAAAVKAAGLDAALAGPTPYTVLVPNDAAFDRLPAGAVDALMQPGARKELTALLTNHILPGTMLAADIGKAIDAKGGTAQIKTLGGGELTASRAGDRIVIADAAGTKATIISADGQRSNGVIHGVDAVLIPTK